MREPLVSRLHARARHALSNLVFFDAAGEDLERSTILEREARYITQSDGLVLLVDPLQIPAVRDDLEGSDRAAAGQRRRLHDARAARRADPRGARDPGQEADRHRRWRSRSRRSTRCAACCRTPTRCSTLPAPRRPLRRHRRRATISESPARRRDRAGSASGSTASSSRSSPQRRVLRRVGARREPGQRAPAQRRVAASGRGPDPVDAGPLGGAAAMTPSAGLPHLLPHRPGRASAASRSTPRAPAWTERSWPRWPAATRATTLPRDVPLEPTAEEMRAVPRRAEDARRSHGVGPVVSRTAYVGREYRGRDGAARRGPLRQLLLPHRRRSRRRRSVRRSAADRAVGRRALDDPTSPAAGARRARRSLHARAARRRPGRGARSPPRRPAWRPRCSTRRSRRSTEGRGSS